MTGRRLNLLISLAILAFFKPLFKTAKNLHKFPSRSETVLGHSQSCYQRHVPRTGYSKSVVTRVVFLKMSRAAIKGRHISCLLSEMKYGKSASFVDYCLFVHPIINVHSAEDTGPKSIGKSGLTWVQILGWFPFCGKDVIYSSRS